MHEPSIESSLKPVVVTVIRCPQCDYVGKVLHAHEGYSWRFLPVALLLACTGIGLIPLLGILLWMGNRTTRTCPRCGHQEEFADKVGVPSVEADVIWEMAAAADAKQFERNKLVLLGVVFALLALAIGFSIWMSYATA